MVPPAGAGRELHFSFEEPPEVVGRDADGFAELVRERLESFNSLLRMERAASTRLSTVFSAMATPRLPAGLRTIGLFSTAEPA